jgi:hypothetical protein
MVPIGSRHAFTIDKLAEEIYQHKASDILVRIQNPIRLNQYNEPEPDICIVKRNDYSTHHPGTEDILLKLQTARCPMIWK